MTRRGRVVALAAGLALLGGALVSAAASAGQKPKPWDGNRTTPVHLIPLLDENNEPIIPTEAAPLPFSAKFTCGPCHEYAAVKSGLHFNAPSDRNPGRPGEPWIWLDPRTGTVLPVSYRNRPGTWTPEALGLSPWDMTLLFGRHMPGGGAAEPGGEEFTAHPDSRWNVSGKAEVNCLACHNRSGRQDHSEWAKQILRENLRWAATAAGAVGEVGGMASRLKGTWDIYDGPNPDDREWAVAPFVKYRTVDFDGKHRYFFDLDYKPKDGRCLACHSVSPAGALKHRTDADVHAASGLLCADCHRNGLDHDMVRGYEGEAAERGEKTLGSFTCRGCHLGEDADGKRRIVPGRMGAPFPKHTGIPLVHFKRLNCTVCHSGSKPEDGLTRVRTSRANRLGIYGAAQWWTETPNIAEPVYVRDGRGKLTPSRLVWPAFWAKLDGKDVLPLKPEAVERAAADALDAETRIARVLAALLMACDEEETAVLVAGGRVFEVNVDGGLDADEDGSRADVLGFLWGVRKDGAVSPLVPDFDPADEERDPDIEPRLQLFLEALATVSGAPGKPVFVAKTTIYQIRDGYFDITEVPEELSGYTGWGRLSDGTIRPLAADFDVRTAVAKAGREETLTEEQVTLILRALAETPADAAAGADPDPSVRPDSRSGPEFGYISGGRLFRLDGKGRLTSRKHPAAAPITWPLAHDVRPAQQSLGRGGCKDCHTAGSDFFFARTKGAGPLLTSKVETRAAHSFMGLGGLFQRLFGLSFAVRPAFKVLLGACALAVGSLLVLAFMIIFGRLSGLLEKR